MTVPSAITRGSERSGAGDALLIWWIALIGADRIDLLGGMAPFHLTPYLVLTPLVLLSELLRRHVAMHPVRMSRQGTAFLTLSFVFLGLVGASVLVSPVLATSASRAALLAVHVMATLAIVIAASDRGDLRHVFERGAVLGLVLFTLFDALQVANLAGLVPDVFRAGPMSIDFVPGTYGKIVPRLGGTVADQNRSGLVLLFYGWFVGYRPAKGPRIGLLLLAFVLSVLTLSRSAAIAGLAAVLILVLERRVRVSPRVLFVSLLLCASGALVLLVSPATRGWVGTALQPFARRLSVDEGSSQEHLTLLIRGIKEATASLPHLALGIGYGSAYRVLDDIFPGNRYGSFHSLYVTIFAECGVFALLCVLVLFVVPLLRGSPYRALVAGAAVFNLFYQAHTEPAFWAILTLAWLSLPARSRVPVATRRLAPPRAELS
jgi:hypothetical protein